MKLFFFSKAETVSFVIHMNFSEGEGTGKTVSSFE